MDPELDKVSAADIVVGIPSFNHSETIGAVVSAAQEGLTKYFPSRKSAVVNSDAGSTDGTPERAFEANTGEAPLLRLSHHLDPADKFAAPYHGIPGRDSAFRTIFSAAQRMGAKACVMLAANLRSISPEWLEALAGPVLNSSFDFVAPYSVRHKFDGTINSGIVYPMMRSLYGKRLRQPLGGDLGLSARLIDHCLNQDVWGSDVARFGIDIWLATQAVCGNFRPCQAWLGNRVHGSRQTAVQLSETLSQVIGALYAETVRNAAIWQRIRNSQPVPLVGDRTDATPEPVTVNARRMLESFRLGTASLQEVWSFLLPPATLLELKRIARQPDDTFSCPDEVWARVIYDFALGYRLRVIPRDHLLRALAPLYLGWLASFVIQTERLGPEETEDRLEKMSLVFEKEKPYLISRWRWPDRFSP